MARPTRAGDRRQPGGNARHRLDGDNRVFLAAVTGVFVADVQEDGTFGKREPTDPCRQTSRAPSRAPQSRLDRVFRAEAAGRRPPHNYHSKSSHST